MKDKLVTIETLDGNENMLVFENPIGLMGYYVKKENIKDLIRKPNVNNAGFYFLLKDKIIKYVGQGNKRSDKSGVIKRLLEHNEDY
jgi:hypothetical protein